MFSFIRAIAGQKHGIPKAGEAMLDDGTEGHNGRGGTLSEYGWKYNPLLSADENYMDCKCPITMQ